MKPDREEVLRMAAKSGARMMHEQGTQHELICFSQDALERFYALAYEAGARAEREECAKVCADRAKDEPGKLPTPEAHKCEAMLCAAAIRARTT